MQTYFYIGYNIDRIRTIKGGNMIEYITLKVDEIVLNDVRDIRPNTLELLKERIVTNGYNPAKPLSVIKTATGYIVADGNHRLSVLRDNGTKEVPCVVYNDDSDLYKIAVKCNQDEDTYAQMDLFDWLNIIDNQRKAGFTQQAIGDKIGWSRENVKNYVTILEKIGTANLLLAKSVQMGRVPNNGTTVPLDFTEWWFRDITKLNLDNQKKIIESFIESKGKLKGIVLKQAVTKLEMYEAMVTFLHDNLLDTSADKDGIIQDIYNGVFQSIERFEKYITKLNESAKNRLLHGDCIELLKNIEDESIALLLTDPPYGMNYKSNHRIVKDYLSTPILNDDENAFRTFDLMFKTIQPKLLPDAHAYVFATWKTYPIFEKIISEHMIIKNVIVWDKMNHSAGDLDNYADRYELIIFASKGDRKLNGGREPNIMQCNRVAGNEKLHPTQKPVELLKHLIEKSTAPKECVCDPFMGVGSTIKACGSRNSYIGIELDDRYYKIAKNEVVHNV